MAQYQIVKEGDSVLRRQAREVSSVDARVQKLMRNMAETMYAANGVGLAAPQVGISKRVIVVDVGDELLCLANPQIISQEGLQQGMEGCLSCPNLSGNVVRAEKVLVEALNEDNQLIQVEATDLKARALQHEIDHLDGILFIDKATDIEVEAG